MSHDAITLIASLSVIASLHLSFALRAHIKRTPVLAAINRTEGGIPSVHIQQCIQMSVTQLELFHETAISETHCLQGKDQTVTFTVWPGPGYLLCAFTEVAVYWTGDSCPFRDFGRGSGLDDWSDLNGVQADRLNARAMYADLLKAGYVSRPA